MKTLAKLGRQPFRGYLAKCINCGEMVVHAYSTQSPLHMHRRSKKCAEAGAKLVKPVQRTPLRDSRIGEDDDR